MAVSTESGFRSGFVALIGRPNSGKSTLLNTVLGSELSPVTPLPQTTRRTITGIYTAPLLQIVFLDTPGIHRGKHEINEAMLRSARAAAESGADCVSWMVDCSRTFGDEDALVARIARDAGTPLLIVFNKQDLCADMEGTKRRFFSVFPDIAGAPSIAITAKEPRAKDVFLAGVDPFIHEGPRYFDGELLTDASMRFFAAEFLRKQIIRSTRDEVPHAVFVEIESYRETPSGHAVGAVIHVETSGQKGIIIGRRGALLARIRAGAEGELAALAGCPVRISCHVTVTPGWRDNRHFLEHDFLR